MVLRFLFMLEAKAAGFARIMIESKVMDKIKLIADKKVKYSILAAF